jgi:hypothetical protein
MRDEQSVALFSFVRRHHADRYLFLPRLLSSGRAVKHFAETNSGNRLRVSDYLAITLAREKLRASASWQTAVSNQGALRTKSRYPIRYSFHNSDSRQQLQRTATPTKEWSPRTGIRIARKTPIH